MLSVPKVAWKKREPRKRIIIGTFMEEEEAIVGFLGFCFLFPFEISNLRFEISRTLKKGVLSM